MVTPSSEHLNPCYGPEREEWRKHRDLLAEAEERASQAPLITSTRCYVVNKCLSTLRNTYITIGTIWNTTFVQAVVGSAEQLQWLIESYQAIGPAIHATRIFNFTAAIFYVPRFVKAAKKIPYRSGMKKFDQAIKAIFALNNSVDTICSIVKGLTAYQLAVSYTRLHQPWIDTVLKATLLRVPTIELYCFGISAISLIMDFRALTKTKGFIEDFVKNSGFKEKGNYTNDDYEKFKQFFTIDGDDKKLRALNRHFQFNGEILARRMLTLFPEGLETDGDKADFAKLMTLLKDRVDLTKWNHRKSLASDIANLAASTFVITAYLHPLGHIALGVYALWIVGNIAHRSLSSMRFETKIKELEVNRLDDYIPTKNVPRPKQERWLELQVPVPRLSMTVARVQPLALSI